MTMSVASRRTAPTKAVADSEQRIVLHDISWNAYKTLCDAVVDTHVRMTYAGGTLEIMVISTAHERLKSLLGLLITALADGLNKVIGGFGSFTHQREDLARALEPDLCFYLGHFKDVRDKLQIDLMTDPPPDLAVEIEVSRSILDRIGILAALGIPEVWRFDGKTIKVLVLGEGTYEERKTSLAFPEIDPNKLTPFLKIAGKEDDNAMMRKVREWAHKHTTTKGKRKAP